MNFSEFLHRQTAGGISPGKGDKEDADCIGGKV